MGRLCENERLSPTSLKQSCCLKYLKLLGSVISPMCGCACR